MSHCLGHIILYSVRESSRPNYVGKGEMWNLQQAPVEESQHKLPDFWSKARNSREIFFEKHLCVLLGFSKHRTLDHGTHTVLVSKTAYYA